MVSESARPPFPYLLLSLEFLYFKLAATECVLQCKKLLVQLFYVTFPSSLYSFHFVVEPFNLCSGDGYLALIAGLFIVGCFGLFLQIMVLPDFSFYLDHSEVELSVLLFGVGPQILDLLLVLLEWLVVGELFDLVAVGVEH